MEVTVTYKKGGEETYPGAKLIITEILDLEREMRFDREIQDNQAKVIIFNSCKSLVILERGEGVNVISYEHMDDIKRIEWNSNNDDPQAPEEEQKGTSRAL